MICAPIPNALELQAGALVDVTRRAGGVGMGVPDEDRWPQVTGWSTSLKRSALTDLVELARTTTARASSGTSAAKLRKPQVPPACHMTGGRLRRCRISHPKPIDRRRFDAHALLLCQRKRLAVRHWSAVLGMPADTTGCLRPRSATNLPRASSPVGADARPRQEWPSSSLGRCSCSTSLLVFVRPSGEQTRRWSRSSKGMFALPGHALPGITVQRFQHREPLPSGQLARCVGKRRSMRREFFECRRAVPPRRSIAC
jgi:hypothetical protein